MGVWDSVFIVEHVAEGACCVHGKVGQKTLFASDCAAYMFRLNSQTPIPKSLNP